MSDDAVAFQSPDVRADLAQLPADLTDDAVGLLQAPVDLRSASLEARSHLLSQRVELVLEDQQARRRVRGAQRLQLAPQANDGPTETEEKDDDDDEK